MLVETKYHNPLIQSRWESVSVIHVCKQEAAVHRYLYQMVLNGKKFLQKCTIRAVVCVAEDKSFPS